MSFAADFDLKERVRGSVDIVDLIGGQLEMRRQGRNYVARCPWHDDRRPSLMINPDRQTWRCWVCDIGGDIFSYVMKRDGVNFPEALQLLGEQAGIPVEELRRGKRAEPGSKDDKTTLLAALRWAVDQYAECFAHSEEAAAARDYAQRRGFTAESLTQFRVGFAPDHWDWLLNRAARAGYSGEVLHACGLVQQRKSGSGYYDVFRNRLLFPIFDLQGRPISLGGRVLPGGEGQGGKYINGRETRLFSKSKQLYGLNWARDAIVRENRALVMEGYTDVLAARQAGIETAVAVLGTALGEPHIRVLKRFAETVVLILDGDQAGQRRADEVLELFVSADVDLRILSLPDGLDPADFLAQRGTPAFTEAVGQAPDAIEHKLRRLTEGLDLTVETHRATQALEAMLAILAKLPPATNALRLQQTLLRLARTFTVPVETLQSRLEQLRRQQRPARRPSERPTVRPEKKNHPPASAAGDQAGPRDPSEALGGNGIDDPEAAENWDAATGLMPAAASDPIGGLDRELFEILIEQPDFVPQAVETIDPAWLTSDSARELLRKYQEHELAGLSLDARDVLLTIENETLKNQLVAMDSRVQQKINAASQTPASRFESIMERYREIEIRAETQMHLTRLDQGLVSEEEELAVLGELFAAQRLRHGLTGRNDQDS